MLSITIIRCGPETSCFLLIAVPRLDEVSLWVPFTMAGRKFRILFKLNSSLKPLLKKLLSGLRRPHAFSAPLLPTRSRDPCAVPPSNVRETREPRTPRSQAPPLPRMDATTRRLALMPPKSSMPVPIPDDNDKRRSSRSCCTFMHNQQGHLRPARHDGSPSSHASQPTRSTRGQPGGSYLSFLSVTSCQLVSMNGRCLYQIKGRISGWAWPGFKSWLL